MEKVQEYLEIMKNMHQQILEYIDSENNLENDFETLENCFNNLSITQSRQKFKGLLHLIIDISNNHQRSPDFFKKVEKILIFVKTEIKQTFSNLEIFNFFKTNKRILLFLIEEKIVVIDRIILLKLIRKNDYELFFLPEISSFYGCGEIIDQNDESLTEFQRKRKIGENDDFLCQLIRNDSVAEFVEYVNKANLPLNSIIKPSFYETNQSLLENDKIELIEYAAFFGSIQILQYLWKSGIELMPKTLNYSIHSNNHELIHFLIENLDNPLNSYYDCLIESIKCHHIEVSDFFKENSEIRPDQKNKLDLEIVKYHNYLNFPEEFDTNFIFPYLCLYDYPILVENFLNNNNIDVNKTVIQNIIIWFNYVLITNDF